MTQYCNDIGKLGEKLAINYLKEKGCKILAHHYTTHWGELDIIAKKDITICFVEVKTRVGLFKGKPYEAVGYYKIRSLMRAIQFYLANFNYKNYHYSLDVISILLNNDNTVQSLQYFSNINN